MCKGLQATGRQKNRIGLRVSYAYSIFSKKNVCVLRIAPRAFAFRSTGRRVENVTFLLTGVLLMMLTVISAWLTKIQK